MDKNSNHQPLADRIHGTRTEKNLQTAVAGEGLVSTRYKIFAEQAKEDGYEEIAGAFAHMSENEKKHATLWLNYLKSVENTHANLIEAAGGEHCEWSSMYKNFAEVAKEEGFPELQAKFMLVASVEESHENIFNGFIKKIESEQVFERDTAITWSCLDCGYSLTGKIAPLNCPLCGAKQAFYQEM